MIDLAKDHYGLIGDFDARFPHGAPALVQARRLEVEGDWEFGDGVRVVGEARLGTEGGQVPDGATLGG